MYVCVSGGSAGDIGFSWCWPGGYNFIELYFKIVFDVLSVNICGEDTLLGRGIRRVWRLINW